MPEVKKILDEYFRRVISSERLWIQLTEQQTLRTTRCSQSSQV
jgi:hypothetical protein